VFLLASIGAAGCRAPATGSVSGKVYYNGKVLKGGYVSFLPAEGQAAPPATIQEDGSYSVPKVLAGPVKICVDTSSLNPANRPAGSRYKPPPGQKPPSGFGEGGDPAELIKRYTWIPPKYSQPDMTTLTYTVTAGAQEHDIKLDAQ